MPRAPFELRNQAFLTGPEIASDLTIEGNTPRKDELNERGKAMRMCQVSALLAKPGEYPSRGQGKGTGLRII